MTVSLAEIMIIADDLSGAAETASTLAPGVPNGIAVLLMPPGGGPIDDIRGPVAIDTDTRYTSPADAARIVTALTSRVPPGRLLLKKVDSLLRGNFASEVSAVARSGRTVVFAPALPRLNRIVRDGRPWADGAPLAAAPSWRREVGAAPADLTEVFPEAVHVPLATVRNGRTLRGALRSAEAGTVLVCDAETDSDLERLAGAAAEAGRDGDVALAGSAALAAALGRLLGAPADSEIQPGAVSVDGRAAFVVGTAEPRARAQSAALRARGASVLDLDPVGLLAGPASRESLAAARAVLAAPVSVLAIGGGTDLDPRFAGPLSRRFAEVVAAACSPSLPAMLTLTGGETARAVLDALRVRRITVRGTINGGAALGTTDAGTTIVTRPGSFGDDDDFLRILERVCPSGYSTLGT